MDILTTIIIGGFIGVTYFLGYATGYKKGQDIGEKFGRVEGKIEMTNRISELIRSYEKK